MNCFRHNAPAVERFDVHLTSEYPGDPTFADIVTGKVKPEYTPIALSIFVCEECAMGVSEYLLERYEATRGHDLRPRVECDDPFHSGARGGDEVNFQGSAWTAVGYRCPTCGFQTLTQIFVPGSIVDDPAYKAIAEVMSRVEGGN